MKKKNLLLPVMPLTCAAVTAFGAPTGDAGVELSDSTVVKLQPVEIVANRATAKTPVAFTEMRRADLDRKNDARDIPYILQSTPSVVTTSDAGAGVGYTSMRVRGTDGSRINVTANGIPINNPESHNVYWVNMPDLASSLNNIQIQRGAGTSTNGAAAFGATINMVTDAPSEEAYSELTGAYGSYGTNRQTLRVGSGLLGNHWSADLRLSHMGSDGYIERASSKLWSYFAQLAYSSRNTNIRLIAFGGKEQTYMAWDYASKEDMKKYGRRYNPCGKYTDDNGNVAYYPDQRDNYIQHHLQLHLLQRIGDHWRVNAALHYTADDGYYNQYKTSRTLKEYGLAPFTDADGQLVKKSDLIRLKKNDNGFGGATMSATYENGPVNAVVGGAANYFMGNHFGQIAWVRNYVGPLNPLQEYYRNRGKKFDSNIFGRINYDFKGGFSAYADMQLRHIHYTIRGISDNFDYNTDAPAVLNIHRDWNFFNPKLGLSYMAGSHRAFASWSIAHKEPTRDNFTDADPLRMPDAETLYDYELGYTFSGQIFSAGVNLYYMYYRDQLVATGELSDTGNPISVNVPSSYRAGVELQASLRPCRWFEWQANATLSRNRIKNFVEYIYEDEWTNPITFDRGNTPIAFSPDFVFNNAFNFSFLGGAEVSLTSQYVSSQYMNNARSSEAKLDAYFVSNLHLAYTFKKLPGIKSLRLGLSVYNVFSEKYFNNGYAGAGYYVDGGEKVIYRYAGYAAQAPANVLATVALRF